MFALRPLRPWQALRLRCCSLAFASWHDLFQVSLAAKVYVDCWGGRESSVDAEKLFPPPPPPPPLLPWGT
ncbi:MAG: hypothetical protein ACKESB_03635 [Candidatus Hodgkinia cicadicola]